MKEVNVVADKFFRFAVRVVNLYKFLCAERKEFILSKQLLILRFVQSFNIIRAD